jgi:hypothetical protein
MISGRQSQSSNPKRRRKEDGHLSTGDEVLHICDTPESCFASALTQMILMSCSSPSLRVLLGACKLTNEILPVAFRRGTPSVEVHHESLSTEDGSTEVQNYRTPVCVTLQGNLSVRNLRDIRSDNMSKQHWTSYMRG